MPDYLELHGCRHDILGHYLKAIGLLRVLARCADEAHCDPDAEGWWDNDKGCFCLRSPRYPTREKLVEFFEHHYQPTPFFSPWNTGGGLNEKKEIEFSIPQKSWQEFWKENRDALLPLLSEKDRENEVAGKLSLQDKPLKLVLSGPVPALKECPHISVIRGTSKGKHPRQFVEFSWSQAALDEFFKALSAHSSSLERIIKFTDAVKKKFVAGKPVLTFDIQHESEVPSLPDINGVTRDVRVKESGKKAVMAVLAKDPRNSRELNEALALGRSFFESFQEDGANERRLLEELRDKAQSASSEAFDSVFTTRVSERTHDSPLFLNRGDAGNGEIFRAFWVSLLDARDNCSKSVAHGLFGETLFSAPVKDGKGTPFFPDAIKAYNIGSGWVTENYPFNALDYILAVEGGFAMRGGVGRTLAANSRRFAAFPFVFDSGEDLVDDANEVKGTSSALWFPLWDRPVTFAELSSFISDAQARLPGKDARFSAEFMRALHSQGVDAGFTGWQEFRFKMKISRVPWITTGAHIESSFREEATRLNRALHPLDESQFLDQFDVKWKGGKADGKSPHPVRCSITSAMETAMWEPTPHNCLDLLCAVFRACRKMAVSESFRDTLSGKRARFFLPLPMRDWNGLIEELSALDPNHPQVGAEFRIARAVASIPGLLRQHDQHARSEAQPMLGSLLPLTLEKWGWHLPLPPKETPSKQAVWTGTDICHDLASILSRRYLDSLEDDQPALRGVHQARLDDILAFLNGRLDDHLIARWIEALSLIGWHFSKSAEGTSEDRGNEQMLSDEAADLAPIDARCDASTSPKHAIPFAYATLRTLLDLECEWQGKNRVSWKKRRSQQPFALLCQRSPTSLSVAVSEALHWISIWGVRNPWGAQARRDKERLSGRDIVRLSHTEISSAAGLADPSGHARRLAAAVCIPLAWEDQWRLRRAVTLPQAI